MKMGFVSAILPDLSFEEVIHFAAANRFECVEVMCWPEGKAERRYAGVTHLDVASLDPAKQTHVRSILQQHGISISGLGYYPNPLCADEAEATVYLDHLKKLITAAAALKVPVVNTFLGRNPLRSVADNWKVAEERWPSVIQHAEALDIKIAIENCPMWFTQDEWPGGKNLPTTPKLWAEMFSRFPSPNLGLNYDPSHLIWQFMDPIAPIREFASKLFHVHAKDARVYPEKLNRVGSLANPLEYHEPKLPGLGQVNWSNFFAALTDVRYDGPVCIEVEDRAYEGSLINRERALRQSLRLLSNYF